MKYLRSYDDAPELIRQVLALLQTVFEFYGETERIARRHGLDWQQITTPFVRFENHRAVAHVGVLDLPLVLNGKELPAGAVHAVACHPDYRRQGYYRSLMEEVLPWCDRRYRTLLLTTSQPELYTPFGFRVLKEHFFVSNQSWQPRNTRYPLHELNRDDESDRALLHRLLDEREPVSHTLGVRSKGIFLFNTARFPVFYAEQCNSLFYYRIQDSTLRLYDVVGKEIPSLQEIVDLMATPLERVEVYFTPDRLQAEFEPDPTPFAEPDFLMVRGAWPIKGSFMLPVTARS